MVNVRAFSADLLVRHPLLQRLTLNRVLAARAAKPQDLMKGVGRRLAPHARLHFNRAWIPQLSIESASVAQDWDYTKLKLIREH